MVCFVYDMAYPAHLRTWIEIDRRALRHNTEQFLNIIPRDARFMAVVKSNAYGHGLVHVAKALCTMFGGSTSKHTSKHWFGVDSIVEALVLRREGIKNPILVLGYTLPGRIPEAAVGDSTLTVSSFEALRMLAAAPKRPSFHIKIDTGMHRQGFLSGDIFKLLRMLKRFKLSPQGVYTHFASAKDPENPNYTLAQLVCFRDVISTFERAGFHGLIRHAAASGGTLLFPESHFDMVRVGMGMYGYWPSSESKISFLTREFKNKKFKSLKPVLTWKTIVSEVKEIPAGSYVGYDGTERVTKPTKIAVLPIGYWHGFDRGLSSIGEVLIREGRCRVLGRVSMDMTVVDATDIPHVRAGDEAVLIGRQRKGAIGADETAEKIMTTPYEFLTRLNPLIERIIKG